MATTNFYTTEAHENAVVISVTSEAAAFLPKECLLDQNLDKSWVPSSTSNQNIDVDCGSAVTVDAMGLWIKNYDTDFSGISIYRYGSANNVDWDLLNPTLTPTNGVPLVYSDLGSQASYRYWRFHIEGIPSLPYVTQVFLLRKRSLSRNHVRNGSVDYPKFDNTAVITTGNRQHIHYNYKNSIQHFDRKYHLVNSTDLTWVDNVISDCSGRRNIFIYNVDTPSAASYVCRMENDYTTYNEIAAYYREVTLKFNSLPYIEAGETI